MRSFKDDKGRTWIVKVTVPAAQRIRAMVTYVPEGAACESAPVPVNIYALLEQGNDLYKRFMLDPELVVATLYSICKPQLDQASVSPEDFGESMDGDAIDQGSRALCEAVVDFSRHPTRRTSLSRMLDASRTVIDKGAEMEAAALDAGLQHAVDGALRKLSDTFGGSQASQESTRTT